MATTKVLIERRGDVTVLRLNAPETLNAVSAPMIEQLSWAFEAAALEARAIVLTGVGRAFCSGAGLNDGLAGGDLGEPDLGLTLETHINPLMSQLRALPIPWIAAVRGAAAGVGCSIALAADLVLAGETAYFLQAFARIGIIPDGGSSHLLARGASRVRAMEMMLLGDKVPAAQALDWGLINRVVPDDRLDDESLALATRLAAGPTKAYGLIRRLAWDGLDSDWETALRLERDLQKAAGRTRDAGEGVAAFLEKRPARFEGR